jgi:hypothetical protein
MELKEWLVKHIEKNPGITFGSIYRDACMSPNLIFNSHDGSIFRTIDELKSECIIDISLLSNHRFFNLSKHFKRDELINKIIE